jgi:hypothetical protein
MQAIDAQSRNFSVTVTRDTWYSWVHGPHLLTDPRLSYCHDSVPTVETVYCWTRYERDCEIYETKWPSPTFKSILKVDSHVSVPCQYRPFSAPDMCKWFYLKHMWRCLCVGHSTDGRQTPSHVFNTPDTCQPITHIRRTEPKLLMRKWHVTDKCKSTLNCAWRYYASDPPGQVHSPKWCDRGLLMEMTVV